MNQLTGKQKRFLRSLAQKLTATVTVGKEGLSQALVGNVERQLSRRELVKVRLPAGPRAMRQAAADELARLAGATCAGLVGRTTILFRPNEALAQDDRIALPQAPPQR